MEKELLVNVRLECVRQVSYLIPSVRKVIDDGDFIAYTSDEKARQLVMAAKILYDWIVE